MSIHVNVMIKFLALTSLPGSSKKNRAVSMNFAEVVCGWCLELVLNSVLKIVAAKIKVWAS